jgi:hypothetical protein
LEGFSVEETAVQQARAKLKQAEKALHELAQSSNFEEAEQAWANFLMQASTVYAKLEQGSKANAASKDWFSEKKKERQSDPLLHYLHYARNAEQHTTTRVVKDHPGHKAAMGSPLKFGESREYVAELMDNQGKVVASGLQAIQIGPSIELTRAHNRRNKDFCDPPASHRGKQLGYESIMPNRVGAKAVEYLTELVEEAAKLAAATEPPSATTSQ